MNATSPQEFSRSLFGEVAASTPSNVVISPLSIYMVLLMSLLGAHEKTKSEMMQTLRLSDDNVHSDLSKICNSISKSKTLKIANSVFFANNIHLRKDFSSMLDYYYDVEPKKCNFNDSEKCTKRINKWAAKQTKGLIKELIPHGALTPATKLILANAVYFKGRWKKPFDKERTMDRPFTKQDGSKKNVKMMHRFSTLEEYGEDELAKWVRIPYREDFNAVFILPKNESTSETMTELVDYLKTKKMMSDLTTKKMKLEKLIIPRFEISFGIDMSKILRGMGMETAFTNDADFSGFTSDNGLHISSVIHKAFVKVDEKGTEAAAASAIHVIAKSLRIGGPPPLEFVADRPFLFMIEDSASHLPLFHARLNKV
jgi:serpin B